VIDSGGHCRISGNLSTLMQRIPYTATGTIGEHIELELTSEKSVFSLWGSKAYEE